MFKILELFHYKGAVKAFLKWKIFSMASFKIISRAKLAGVHPSTIVDVGANIGQFSVTAANIFPNATLVSIEPDPIIAEELRSNLPEAYRENVKVFAVGDTCGEVIFNVNADSQNSSILPLGIDRKAAFPENVVLREIPIPLVTLDSLFSNEKLKKPILLKIDVQGFEDRVIKGAVHFLADVDWVILEISFSKLYEGESEFNSLNNMLKNLGFVFLRPLNFHLSPINSEIIEIDALFTRSKL